MVQQKGPGHYHCSHSHTLIIHRVHCRVHGSITFYSNHQDIICRQTIFSIHPTPISSLPPCPQHTLPALRLHPRWPLPVLPQVGSLHLRSPHVPDSQNTERGLTFTLPTTDSYDEVSIMKEEAAHKEHKSSPGLSSTLKKVKAKFHSEEPKPKPKLPYTRDRKLADTVSMFRILAGRSTLPFCNA